MDRKVDGKAGMPQSGRVIILGGDIGSGKTTLCLKVVEKLKSSALNVAGVVCPPVFNGKLKTGIDLLDLRSDEKRLLAKLNIQPSDGIQTKRWLFNEEALRWGNTKLAAAIPCDLLVIDELGPLEFERGLGFINGLTALDSGLFTLALVVIRSTLHEKAKFRWPASEIIDVNSQTRDSLVTELVNLINR